MNLSVLLKCYVYDGMDYVLDCENKKDVCMTEAFLQFGRTWPLETTDNKHWNLHKFSVSFLKQGN